MLLVQYSRGLIHHSYLQPFTRITTQCLVSGGNDDDNGFSEWGSEQWGRERIHHNVISYYRVYTYSVLSFPLQLYQWESNSQHFCQRRNSEYLQPKCLTLMCDLAMMVNLLFTRGLSTQIGTISIFRQIHEHEIGCQAGSVIGKSSASTMVSIAAFTGGFHCAILLEPFQFRVNPPLLFPSHPPPSLPGLNLNRNSQFRSW